MELFLTSGATLPTSNLQPSFLTHLSDTFLKSAQWHFPIVLLPDRTDMQFERRGEWLLPPTKPFLAAKKAFITDGRAISYAESCMGIVEYYKLGAIVGAPTAGTNGNTNPFPLPGGYFISWTGMKVLKLDGSRHHGLGSSRPFRCLVPESLPPAGTMNFSSGQHLRSRTEVCLRCRGFAVACLSPRDIENKKSHRLDINHPVKPVITENSGRTLEDRLINAMPTRVNRPFTSQGLTGIEK